MGEDLTQYDYKPKEFVNYLRYYGEHFSKKLCEFACDYLGCDFYDKDKIKALFETYKVKIKANKLYDAVYIANYLKSIYFNSGILDERNLVMFIKTMLEKEEDVIFVKFLALTAKKGIAIYWEDMI